MFNDNQQLLNDKSNCFQMKFLIFFWLFCRRNCFKQTRVVGSELGQARQETLSSGHSPGLSVRQPVQICHKTMQHLFTSLHSSTTPTETYNNIQYWNDKMRILHCNYVRFSLVSTHTETFLSQSNVSTRCNVIQMFTGLNNFSCCRPTIIMK